MELQQTVNNDSVDDHHHESYAETATSATPSTAAPRTSELLEADTVAPVFFFGALKDNGYLSQMFIAPFEIDGVLYNCNEQFFHAQKALTFKDEKTKDNIMKEMNPRKQKKLGRRVHPFDDEQWRRVAYQFVVNATYAKFETHEDLRRQLLATGNREIAETSPFDKIWGVGMGRKRAEDYKGEWPGQNLLGKAIMEVRERLRVECSGEQKSNVTGGEN